MDPHKLEDFADEHPGEESPRVDAVPTRQTSKLVTTLMARFCPCAKTESDFIRYIAREPMVDNLAALDEDFDFTRLLKDSHIEIPSDVFLNFTEFDRLERMRYSDFAKYFRNVYWPATDDLDCFDETLNWIVSIDHDGNITLLQHQSR